MAATSLDSHQLGKIETATVPQLAKLLKQQLVRIESWPVGHRLLQ